MKVELRPVTRDNWRQCIRLELAPEQKRHVASNVGSLAESRFEPHYVPTAIYADDAMVGFIMFCPDIDTDQEGLFWIFRLMIDHQHQRNGIGQQALQLALREIARRGGRRVKISYVPDNKIAAILYERIGFEATGEVEDGEIIMAIDLD
ncbi:MAG: GNAT family N-acetyltransferase [Gammaproteobacteria bacterium]|nr:MAG: GNAT family N-acetyltransferase [Gammaproteobacteria bacterium]